MVRQIFDKDFISLVELYAEYNQYLSTKHNKSVSTSILINELSQAKPLVLGLYIREALVGFTIGKQHTEEVFHFSGMYIRPRYRYYTSLLFKESEKLVKQAGYKAFTATSSTQQGFKALNKIGCKPIETKFYKEI